MLRTAVDEDDEAEAEALLVVPVQLLQLGHDGGVVVRALLGGRVLREPLALADRGVRVEHLLLLGIGERRRDLAGVIERMVGTGELLDERGASLEELGELVGGQLPR